MWSLPQSSSSVHFVPKLPAGAIVTSGVVMTRPGALPFFDQLLKVGRPSLTIFRPLRSTHSSSGRVTALSEAIVESAQVVSHTRLCRLRSTQTNARRLIHSGLKLCRIFGRL